MTNPDPSGNNIGNPENPNPESINNNIGFPINNNIGNPESININPESININPESINNNSKIRCEICDLKVKFYAVQCKCKRKLCKYHVFPQYHDCDFDYKSEGKRILQNTLVPVRAPKI